MKKIVKRNKAAGRTASGKQNSPVVFDPELDDQEGRVKLKEQKTRALFLSFGRMNPPTVGHERHVEAMKKMARAVGAEVRVYVSHSQDKLKNPLPYKEKIELLRRAFGPVVVATPYATLITILKSVDGQYDDVTVVVGADRVKEFNNLVTKYNGREWKFNSIKAISSGDRVKGISGTDMRNAAQRGDLKTFAANLPTRLRRDAASVFAMVRAGMLLGEQLEQFDNEHLNEALSIQQRRKRGLVMRRYRQKIKRARMMAQRRLARSDTLKRRANKAARQFLRKRVAGSRGVKYAALSPTEKMQVDRLVDKRKSGLKRIAQRLLPMVRRKETQRLRAYMQSRQKKNEQIDFDHVAALMMIETMEASITAKELQSINNKAVKISVNPELLESVFIRGLIESDGDRQKAFNRVNGFIAGNEAIIREDFDLANDNEKV